MKISILCARLNANGLGRVYLLAQMLQDTYGVEIIGPESGDGIWNVVRHDTSLVIKKGINKKDLLNKIEGDIIIAAKPLYLSFRIGILKKIKTRKPLILDIDDWELGFLKDSYRDLPFFNLKKLTLLYEIWKYWLNEKLIFFADEIIVSGNFLKKKFGGEIIWHARDTNLFDPAKYNCSMIRKRFGFKEHEKIIMFFGTPRHHKGLDDLIEALALINNAAVKLVVAGLGKDRYSEKIKEIGEKKLGKRFAGFGLVPFHKAPEVIASADIIVIPQKKNFSTLGQVPAKVFDAMAMAKPIIATDVSDLPGIINGCGWITEPGNPEKLSLCIQYVLDHPAEAKIAGLKAREKCNQQYSTKSMKPKLLEIVNKLKNQSHNY